MNKQLIASGITALFVGTLCTLNFANAQTDGRQTSNDTEDTEITQNAIGGADAPSVRIAALIDGNLGGFTVVRSKGIASISSPETGIVCIQPSGSINVNNIVPIVSVDFSRSLGNDNLVQYRSSGTGCPSGNIAVRTFRFDKNSSSIVNSFVPADAIAFTIIVP